MRALILTLALSGCLAAEAPPGNTPTPALTTYLGNEALMVADGDAKVLFDPLFPNGFGIYQMLPDAMRSDLMAGVAPYDQVDAIFVSHAHPDHFEVGAVITYLETHLATRLFAPTQAVEWMQEDTETANPIFERVTAIPLEYGDAPLAYSIGSIAIDVVRIPHAGWPDRADVSNLVYRVTLPNGETVMHLGDADPDDTHYAQHPDHWPATTTDTAYPPYWFYFSDTGRTILDTRLNADHAIGIHVPMQLPDKLASGQFPHFHTPGETHPVRPGPDTSEPTQ